MKNRIALLQVRKDPQILIQEQQCFLERCEIDPDQLVAINVFEDRLTPALFQEVDALMIGGAGAFSMTEDYDWTDAAMDLIREATTRSFPTFGSCFGHQMIARALGGEVIYDAERTEMGCHEVRLTTAGKADPLFSTLPEKFKANMGHHDRVSTLPPGAIELADNDSQPYQAFRIINKPIYGTQFHTELDAAREKERLYAYRSYYTEVASEEAFQEIIDSLAETTEADRLLKQFCAHYL